MILPVIMAGGSGSRLWPISRASYPKQFLKLNGEGTMLQETILRLNSTDIDSPLIICNEEHRFLAAEQLRQIKQLNGNILLEPAGRNTAPAIALAAFWALQQGHDPVLLVLAADHIIKDQLAFQKAVASAIIHAENDKLVTFGIVPTAPEIGYGYIQRGPAHDDAFEVTRFVEKPTVELAQQYLNSGDFYWNSGMFMFRASRYLAELKRYRTDIYETCERAARGISVDSDFIRVSNDAFMSCPEDSIDYAVME
jgi:mannose-1-phosphate guanylyltransferase